ncbi:MAG: hypothetical protein WCW13_04725 [archaeon]
MTKYTLAIIILIIVVLWLMFGGFDVISNLFGTINFLHLFGLI